MSESGGAIISLRRDDFIGIRSPGRRELRLRSADRKASKLKKRVVDTQAAARNLSAATSSGIAPP